MSVNTEPLSWAQVSQRGASGLYTAIYITLLGTALFHGLYGLRTVLTEFWTGERAAKRINVGCWFLGLGLFLVGTLAAIFYHLQQAAA